MGKSAALQLKKYLPPPPREFAAGRREQRGLKPSSVTVPDALGPGERLGVRGAGSMGVNRSHAKEFDLEP